MFIKEIVFDIKFKLLNMILFILEVIMFIFYKFRFLFILFLILVLDIRLYLSFILGVEKNFDVFFIMNKLE